jgi:hypothetical protein
VDDFGVAGLQPGKVPSRSVVARLMLAQVPLAIISAMVRRSSSVIWTLAAPDRAGCSIVIYNPDLDPERTSAARIVRFVSDLVSSYTSRSRR